jgi:hypothetical protein
MALWKPVNIKRKNITNSFGSGINVGIPGYEIKEGEVTYIRNMDSHEYPGITTRYDRTLYNSTMPSLSSPFSIGERNNSQLHVLYDKYWSYWDTASSGLINLSSSLSSTDGEIMDFNTGSKKYTLMMNSTQLRYWDGESTSSTSYTLGDANTPYTKIFTVHKGRIFAGKGATLYYCGLNLINDWTTPNSAGAITISQTKGEISGISVFGDKVIVFTQCSMHELFGTSPDYFEFINIESEVGCASRRSIVRANKKLYWMWTDGIYEFDGGSPTKISMPVKEYIKSIDPDYLSLVSAGSQGEYIYFAIPYNGSTSNNLLLVYDTNFQKWYVDTGNFIDFATIGSNVYGLDSTGGIYNMRDTNTGKDNGISIPWDMITKPYIVASGNNRETLEDVSLLYRGSSDATLNVYYSTHPTNNDSSSFNLLAASSDFTLDNNPRTKRLLLPSTVLQDESVYRLRYTGSDDITIYRQEQNFRIKRR